MGASLVEFIASAIVCALDLPAAMLAPDGRLLAVNQAWREVGELPAEPGDPLPPAPPRPLDAAALASAIATAAGGRPGDPPTGLACTLRGGSRVRFRCAPLPAADGTGHVLVTLAPAVADLAAGTEAFGAEVRTPISGIVGMVDLLLALPLEPEVHEVVEGVRLSADALTSMLNDMVDLARIEVGRLRLDEVPFDLRRLVDEVAETLGGRARQKGLALVVRIAPEIPPRLLGDDARLRQALLNLVGNAITFTEVGEVVLNVEVAPPDQNDPADPDQPSTQPDQATQADRPDQDGPADRDGPAVPRISIEVVDTGRGMAPDAIDRVFEPFVPADASTARRYGGSGLGLAVTARLVRLMRGRVEVDAAPAVGSRFRVVLPLRRPAGTPAPGVPSTGVPSTGVPRPGGIATPGVPPAGFPATRGPTPGVPAGRPGVLAGKRILVSAPGAARSAAALAALLRGEGAGVDVLAADPLAEVLARQQEGEPVDAVVWVDDARDTRIRARAAGVANALPGGATVLLSRTDPPRQHPAGVIVLALPARADRLLDAVRGIAPVPERPVPVEPLPGGRVLLAEDNEVNRAIIGRMLDLLGLRWDSVSSGPAAVAAARTERYDAILMDVQMPGTDGVEATRRIRAAESDRHTPIVALTANAIGGARETYLAAGMDDYLAKPMRLATLRATLARYVSPALEVSAADLDASRLADLATQLQDAALVTSTVELFLAELPGRCTAITEAAERLDRAALHAAAHGLKSASAMLGATAIADLCERLMTVADDGTAADMRALTAAIPATADRTEVAIRRYLTST